MLEWLNKVEGSFYKAFLAEDRWKLYFAGLGVTLKVAFFAAILGLVIGTVIALMKLSTGKKGKGTIWSFIANCYIDIIRGTPSVLQLLIMWFIIMKNCKTFLWYQQWRLCGRDCPCRNSCGRQGTDGSRKIAWLIQGTDHDLYCHSAGD